MAEPVENGLLVAGDGDGSHQSEITVAKITPLKAEFTKQNGISEHEDLDEVSRNGTSGETKDETNDEDNKDETNTKDNDSKSETSKSNVDSESDIKPEDNNDDSYENEKEGTVDSVPMKSSENPVVVPNNRKDVEIVGENNCESPVTVNTGDDSSEVMEVDDDNNSNVVEVSSNTSPPNSDVVEVDPNNSNNPSVISEDSSRDSVESEASAKSGESETSSKNDGIVGTVKDDDGADIMITLNDETEGDKSEDCGEGKEDVINDVDEINDKDVVESKESSGEIKKDKKDDDALEKGETETQETSKTSAVNKTENPKPSKVAHNKSSTSLPVVSSVPVASVSLPVATTSAHQTVIVQGPVGQIPVGAQLVQQGQQLGYVTRLGNQNLFVPVSSVISNTGKGYTATANQHAPQQKSAGKIPIASVIKAEEYVPKSSTDMIDRMKWEMQNRYPDNYNWSVAFHPKKEELSSITSFLLELGHDVVKEAVYKDIIQIQTKKNEAGNLKENEIESLEKMKTVYENTKKKVEHLQLDMKKCNGCKFKTESSVIMNHHKDFPHCDPPFDLYRSWLSCPHCKFTTKVVAQFSFHMETVHKLVAKLPEKTQNFQCELCPLSTKTKNKLEKHRAKCVKHFKLNVNLQAYYHDVNFCMKTCYYKPKKPPPPKPVAKPPAPTPPPKPVPQPRPTMATRNNQLPSPVVMAKQAAQVHRPPPPLVRHPQPQQKQQQQTVAFLRAQQQAAQLRGSYTGSRPGLNPASNLAAQRPPQQRPVRPPGKEMSGFEVCELCGGYVKDRQALRIHFYYAHKVEMPQAIFNRPSPPLICDVCQSKFWTTQGLSKHKSTLRHYSTSGTHATNVNANPGANQQCFMCMRKVTNLFVHIEQIHGMTMKDLVAMRKCIMCGITAPDKKALEVHMASVHGVLIKANDFAAPEKPRPPGMPNLVRAPQAPAAAAPAVHKGVRSNFCVFCQIQFADNIQLTVHCMKIHATCNSCGMVVATSNNLVNHRCKQMKRSCVICDESSLSPEAYAAHIKTHVKPCKVTIMKMSENEISQIKDKIKREYKPQVISLDSEEDSDVEVVDTNTNPSRTKGPIQRNLVKSENKISANNAESEVKSENNAKSELKSENKINENNAKKDVKSENKTVASANDNEKTEVDKDGENIINESNEDKSEPKDTVDKIKEVIPEQMVKEEEIDSSSEEKEKVASEQMVKEEEIDSSSEEKEKVASEQTVKEEEIDSSSEAQEKPASEQTIKEKEIESNEINTDVEKVTSDKVELTDDKVCSTVESPHVDGDEGSKDEVLKLEEKLLEVDDSSKNSKKRRMSESDGNEEELLRDDSEIKRQKLDETERTNQENIAEEVMDNQSANEIKIECDINKDGETILESENEESTEEIKKEIVDSDRGVKRELEEQEKNEEVNTNNISEVINPVKRLKTEDGEEIKTEEASIE